MHLLALFELVGEIRRICTHRTVLTNVLLPIERWERDELIFREQYLKWLFDLIERHGRFEDRTSRLWDQLPQRLTVEKVTVKTITVSENLSSRNGYLQKRLVMEKQKSEPYVYSSRSLAPKYALADPTLE